MDQQLTPQQEEWLSIRDEHIRQLQQELEVVMAALKTTQGQVRELTKLNQENLASVERYRQEADEALLMEAQMKGNLSALEQIVAALKAENVTPLSAPLQSAAIPEPQYRQALQEIDRLKEALRVANGDLERAQQNMREINAVRQEHVAFVTAYQQKTTQLEQEVARWQHDYEQLRIQKGGFGFKMLLLVGTMSALFGMAAGWLFFRQRDPNAVLFSQFQKENAFNLEYNLSHRQYDAAEQILETAKSKPMYGPIAPEIAMIENLVKAVRLQGDSTLNSVGYSVVQPDTISTVAPKPSRTLSIVHGDVRLHTEALTDAPVLAALKKKDKVDQWDKTPDLAKVRTVNAKGQKGIAEDYWYEVETIDGSKGWVFGYFTNASLNRFKPDVPDSTAAPVRVDTTRRN